LYSPRRCWNKRLKTSLYFLNRVKLNFRLLLYCPLWKEKHRILVNPKVSCSFEKFRKWNLLDFHFLSEQHFGNSCFLLHPSGSVCQDKHIYYMFTCLKALVSELETLSVEFKFPTHKGVPRTPGGCHTNTTTRISTRTS